MLLVLMSEALLMSTHNICSHVEIRQLFIILLIHSYPEQTDKLQIDRFCRPGGAGFYPRRVRQLSLVEIDHEIILYRQVIQEGHLSVSGEKNVLKYWLTAQRIKPAKEKCR